MALSFNPSEVASIVVGGMTFDNWTSIEVERTFGSIASFMKVVLAEGGPLNLGFVGLKIGIGVPATGMLAGIQVINGKVDTRQVFYDKDNHIIELRVFDNSLAVASVKPKQYDNQSLAQIAQDAVQQVGWNFQLVGSPAGADKPFYRVNPHVGEPIFTFVERLCRMRNVNLIDDPRGNYLLAVRASGQGGGAINLTEGENIVSARLVMRNDLMSGSTHVDGEDQGRDDVNSNDTTTHGDAKNSYATGDAAKRANITTAEQPGDNTDMDMRAKHEVAYETINFLEAVITVQGWLDDGGMPYILRMTGGDGTCDVNLNSPMIWPNTGGVPQQVLKLKGVRHLQDSENGTRTELTLCLPQGLSGEPGTGLF
jgi:prophage tail gpP-like protein